MCSDIRWLIGQIFADGRQTVALSGKLESMVSILIKKKIPAALFKFDMTPLQHTRVTVRRKAPKSGVLIGVICLLGALSLPVIGSAEVRFLKPDFQKVVTGVTPFGELIFDDDKPYRLWGLHPIPELLREEAKGKFLACISAGSLELIDSKETHRSDVILCTYPRSENFRVGLKFYSEKLIRDGAATELCSESRGYFGSCR